MMKGLNGKSSYSRFHSELSDSDSVGSHSRSPPASSSRDLKSLSLPKRGNGSNSAIVRGNSWPHKSPFTPSSPPPYSPTGSTPHFGVPFSHGRPIPSFNRRANRWRWLRHPLVRPLLQLPAEAFAGCIFWTLLVEFLHGIWWFQLSKNGLAPEIFFLLYLFLPAIVLGHRFSRNYLDEHPWSRALLLLGGLVGVGGQMDSSPIERLAFSGSGVGIMGVYVYEGVWAGTATRRRKAGFGLAGGVLLLQVMQWALAGRNLLVASWWGLLFFGLIPGVGVAGLVLYEDLAEWEGEEFPPGDASGERGTGTEMMELLETDRTEVLSDDWDQIEVGTADDLSGIDSTRGPTSRRESERLFLPRDSLQRNPIHLGPPALLDTREGGGSGNWEGYAGDSHSPRPRTLSGADRHSPRVSGGAQQLPQRGVGGGAPLLPTNPMATAGKRWGEGEEVPWASQRPVGADEDGYDSELDLPLVNKEGRWRFRRSGSVRSVQMAVGLGSLLFLTHMVLTAPTFSARWVGHSPSLGLVSMLALGMGVGAAAEVARNSLPKRMHGVLAWLVGAGGGLWLALGGPAPELGGFLLAFAAPSLWVVMARNVFGVYTGLGLCLTTVVYISFVLWSAALVAYQEMPGGAAFRATDGWLIGTCLLGVGVGLMRGPDVTAEERREFGSRLGAWRLGRLTWGSGVPDRQAVGALLAVVVAMVAVATVARTLPSSSAAGGTPALVPGGDLLLLSFNLYQGFNRKGGVNFDAILQVVREQKAHIVLLQETDLMRIIHGNQDMVEYLSTWLHMYSLYSPPTRADTWGCAILSVFPLSHASSEALPSPHGENGCFQHAYASLNGRKVRILNAHFGDLSAEVEIQAERVASLVNRTLTEAAKEAKGKGGGEGEAAAGSSIPALVLGGDFNLRPLSHPYKTLMASGLSDARVAILGEWNGEYERDPGAGYVFASPGLKITAYQEPHYDQDKTSDGFPIVVSMKLS